VFRGRQFRHSHIPFQRGGAGSRISLPLMRESGTN
jgi:hypothetical protein